MQFANGFSCWFRELSAHSCYAMYSGYPLGKAHRGRCEAKKAASKANPKQPPQRTFEVICPRGAFVVAVCWECRHKPPLA